MEQEWPVLAQWKRIRQLVPDTLILMRIGDFYEAFDDDAQALNRVTGAILSRRRIGKREYIPMAGVPHHAVQGYVDELLAAGYRVALIEQGPFTGTGPCERWVDQVLEPKN